MDNKLLGRITVCSDVQGGKPCIKGSRIPVYIILEAFAMGEDFEEIKKDFPPLTDEDIKACLLFASLLAKEEEMSLSLS